ncbi:hypothetical protein QF002_000957 [Paraburkholderia youngii]
MTPEQMALKAHRQRNEALRALCDTAGAPLYEARAYRPAEGCKCSISRRARVYRLTDGRLVVEGIEIWNRRFPKSSASYSEAPDETLGQSLADQYLARRFL